MLVLVTMPTGRAQAPLNLKVHTGRGQIGYDVNSTMVIGEKELLIDPAVLTERSAQAGRRDPRIKEAPRHDLRDTSASGSSFGLAVLTQAFPDAKIVALPATVNAAKTGWPARQKFWFPPTHEHPRT